VPLLERGARGAVPELSAALPPPRVAAGAGVAAGWERGSAPGRAAWAAGEREQPSGRGRAELLLLPGCPER